MVEELNANQFLWPRLSIWQGTVGGCGFYIHTYIVIKSEPLNINGWSIKLKYMPTDVCAKCESVCGWLDVYNYGEGKAPAGREL